MPKRNLAWMLVIFLVVLLFWTLPGTLAGRDSLYRAFGPLVAVRAQMHKHFVDELDDRKLLEGAIRGMVAELDSFSGYISPGEYPEYRARETEGVFNGVGIEVELVQGQLTVVSPIEGTPAFFAGIVGGDRILGIDGKPTESMSLAEAVNRITGEPGTAVRLRMESARTGRERELELRRTRVNLVSIKGCARLEEGQWDLMLDAENSIAYVRVSRFIENTAPLLKEKLHELRLAGMKGLVLDLRFNPGGLLDSAVAVTDCFLKEGLIVSTRGRRSDEKKWYATSEAVSPSAPVAVLINESSASASEIVSGALQDHKRATIVGERSFGKGSVQNLIELEGHGALKLTTAYYYLPSGRRIHRMDGSPASEPWGIMPDIEVPLDEKQLAALKEGWRRVDAVGLPEAAEDGQDDEPAGDGGPAPRPRIPIDPQLAEALRVLRAELSGVSSATASGDDVSGSRTR